MFDFTFCAINVDFKESERYAFLKEIKNVEEKCWYKDKFRNCEILPIINSEGTVKAPKRRLDGTLIGVNRSHGDMIVTEAGHQCKTLVDFIYERIFPFMNPIGRTSILRTQSNIGLNLHIDSNKDLIGTRQHKFRVALNDKIDKLYFMDKNMNKIYVPSHYRTYAIDGTHLHATDPIDEEKITVCIGLPWSGEHNEKYDSLIHNSPFTMKVSRPKIKENWVCTR